MTSQGKRGPSMIPRLLVVEYNEAIAPIITGFLQSAYRGSKVVTAYTYREAFQKLSHFTPHLIMTDMSKKPSDGYKFLHTLREKPKTQLTPVIAMSAFSLSEHEELRQYREGFNAVLTKPFSIEELVKCINRVLALHQNPDLTLIHMGFEHQSLDYKETIDLNTKHGIADLAKDVIAMANWGGGTIVVGVAERKPGNFVCVGVTKSLLDDLEVSQLNKRLRTFLDPQLPVISRQVRHNKKLFVVIEIPPASDMPILAAKKNEKVSLYPGRIYTRTSAAESAEVQTSSELREILLRLNNAT